MENSDTTPHQTPKMSHNFKIVITFGLVMIIINGICALYMLGRTLGRWVITKKSLPMALRVPFYIALSDFIIFSINFPNMLYPNIYGVPWSSSVCKVIGGVTSFAISINMTLVGLLAFLTYLRICRKMFIDLGRFDYKGILFVLTTSLTYSLISIPSYDSGKYWCFTSKSSIHILSILTLTLNFTILIITIFSYSSILREINSIRFINEHNRERVRERNENINDDDNNNNFLNRTRSILNRSGFNNNNNYNNGNDVKKNTRKIEPIVVRKIIGYVLIFIIQWTPPMIYVLGQLINYDPLWVYLITDATVNMGGIGNMIQFIINEGWRDKYDHPTLKGSTSTDSSFVGISPEPIIPSPPLNLLPRIFTSEDEPNFIKVKIDTTTSINLDDYFFENNENNGKLRPYSSSSSTTKVSNNNDYEYFTNHEDSNITFDTSSEANLINTSR
ncbi:hypothetical protein C1645_813654 [Glomus cerebriforme]|uniref:G-protein coupled receptors family 1 profile domain-containing protein n=1 Tax=Glomus cerebriforme TaxID=658196 RepID=A0A397TK81_9GLOM|nr:hypothetical protein C1645_813654 [Glomus cerebriforme]